MSHASRRTLAGLVAGLASLVVAGGTALADDALAPGTRPMFFDLGLGPTFLLGTDQGSVRGTTIAAGKLQTEFGYHFSGDSSGAALGPNFEIGFREGYVSYAPGLKFWYDIQLTSDLGIYLTPEAKLGYAGVSINDTNVANAFEIEIGLELRLVINDRGLIGFRPITVDMWAGDSALGSAGGHFVALWDMMFDGGVTF